MSWSLVTYASDDLVGMAVLRADGVVVAPRELKRWTSTLEMLGEWPGAEGVLRDLDVDDAPVVDAPTLLAPLRWPRKVVCAGVNYRSHSEEMGADVPAIGWTPFFFLKAPTTTVIGPSDKIAISRPEVARFDWEVELAAVIGVGGRDIPTDKALSCVAGYCVANDLTARGLFRRAVAPAEPFCFDWLASKSADGSLPIGPGITPSFQVCDPQNLRMRLFVNGELQQDGTTADMICTVAELISSASALVTLEPGDVILTGTPSGVGAGRGLYLRPGDVVRATIEGLGTLENEIIDRSEKRP